MEKSTLFKIGIGVIIVLLLGYFYLTAEPRPTYNWKTDFKVDSKDPYGCYLLYELIKTSSKTDDFRQIDQPISKVLADFKGEGANYLFIGSNWYYTEEDISSLIDFIALGNNAYVVAEDYPYEILNEMDISSIVYFGTFSESEVNLKIEEDSISLTYLDNWKKEAYIWTYADSISDDRINTLGSYGGFEQNFLKVDHGEGSLFLHFVPLAFTNFHLKEEDKLAYANKVFSEFNVGVVFWDNFSKIPNSKYNDTQSPLSFILSQESLRWAWYILLAVGVIYILLYTKRKQRVIPVLSQAKNTSIEYVQTIGSIYYHDEARLKIIGHQKRLFLSYLKTRYGVSPADTDKAFLKKVSLKSGIKEGEIDMILKEAKRLELRGDVTNKDLIAYNKLIENFYSKSK